MSKCKHCGVSLPKNKVICNHCLWKIEYEEIKNSKNSKLGFK
jgi:uncharacterized OB-fold protein